MSEPTNTTEQIDDPEMGSTWFLSFVGIIFFVSFCLAVSVLFFGVQRNFDDIRVVDERPLLSTGPTPRMLMRRMSSGCESRSSARWNSCLPRENLRQGSKSKSVLHRC